MTQVEFVSRDSRQLFFDALGRSAPSDGSSGSSSRRYEPSSPRSRGRGGGSGYYDNRWDRGRGGRGNTRRDMSSHRPWHRGGGEYEYSEGSGYHQRGHVRYRGSYEGAGYESDDYDQELRDYNYSRQREREKEQGRQRHERGGRDRDREDGNYSGNERFYPDNQERWREDRSSSGSYEESRDRKDARPRDFNDEHDRERPGYSEDDDRASLHSKPANRDIAQDEKRTKRKEKRRRKPRSPTPEGEAADSKEVLSDGEEADERKILDEKKPRKGRSGEAEIVTKGKEAETVERVRDERRLEGNGTKDADVVVKDGEKELAPASTPPEKGIKKKEKKDAKKRRKHKRIRGSLGEEEEERELEEETARMEEAAGKEAAADMVIPVSKSRVSVDTDSQRLESRETDENVRLDRPEFENQKPPRRHSSEERLLKEEREFSRDAGSRSPRKSHRDERRRDWEKTDVVRPKRRRTSDGESPPPPPPPPPPPQEAVEGFPPADVLPRVALVPDGLPTQMVRPPYDVTPAPPVRYEPQLYDGNRAVPVVASPATLSPVPPAGIPLNPAVVVPPNVSTPPLAVHSPGVPIGVPAVPSLASPQGLPPPPPPHPDYNTPPPVAQQSNADTLLDLLRRYPVVWQGLLALKNDSAAVQMHYLAGNGRLAEVSLPQAPANGIGSVPPPIRIAQRMKLEPSQLEGVIRRMQVRLKLFLLLSRLTGNAKAERKRSLYRNEKVYELGQN